MPDSECTRCSISFTASTFSTVRWRGKTLEGMSCSQVGHTYIEVLYQDRHCAHYGLQRREHVGGLLGNLDGHPGCGICRLPT